MTKQTSKMDRQHDRYNWFCCVSNIPEQMESLKETCKTFKRWFWIEHLPDKEDSKPHIHVMVMYGGSCYLRTAAQNLDIPENFVQFCKPHRSYAQYMVHLHENEKIKYSAEDVHSNFPGLYKSMLIDSANDDVTSLFSDLRSLRSGKITLDQFIELHYYELQKMPLYQKIKTFEYLEKNVRTTT